MADDLLLDFERVIFEHDGKSRTVFRLGSGPAVLVMAEIPGITPKVAAFARAVAEIGCTAVLPHLFGTPGKDADPSHVGTAASLRTMTASLVPACISREFTTFATGKTSPVVAWLRALGSYEHQQCGGPGYGAVGMCFTGGFALAMAVDDEMLAPVLSQPSMPVGITRRHRQSIDISAEDFERVKYRCAHDGLEVLGLRFTSDSLVPGERFEMLRRELGDAFVAFEIGPDDANPAAMIPPHSVLTEHLIDEPGQPTRNAYDAALELFRRKLLC